MASETTAALNVAADNTRSDCPIVARALPKSVSWLSTTLTVDTITTTTTTTTTSTIAAAAAATPTPSYTTQSKLLPLLTAGPLYNRLRRRDLSEGYEQLSRCSDFKDYTLVVVPRTIDDNGGTPKKQLLFGMKRRGFGVGKWNGYVCPRNSDLMELTTITTTSIIAITTTNTTTTITAATATATTTTTTTTT